MTEWIDLTLHPRLPVIETRVLMKAGRHLSGHKALKESGLEYHELIETEIIQYFMTGNCDTKITYTVLLEEYSDGV